VQMQEIASGLAFLLGSDYFAIGAYQKAEKPGHAVLIFPGLSLIFKKGGEKRIFFHGGTTVLYADG